MKASRNNYSSMLRRRQRAVLSSAAALLLFLLLFSNLREDLRVCAKTYHNSAFSSCSSGQSFGAAGPSGLHSAGDQPAVLFSAGRAAVEILGRGDTPLARVQGLLKAASSRSAASSMRTLKVLLAVCIAVCAVLFSQYCFLFISKKAVLSSRQHILSYIHWQDGKKR